MRPHPSAAHADQRRARRDGRARPRTSRIATGSGPRRSHLDSAPAGGAEAWGKGATIDSAPAPAGSALEATDNAGHVVTDWRIVVLKQKIVRRCEPTSAPTAPDMLQHASLTPSVIVAHNRLSGQGRTFLTAWQTQPQECSMSECCRCWWPPVSSAEWTRTCPHLSVVQPALPDTLNIPTLAATCAPGLARKAQIRKHDF